MSAGTGEGGGELAAALPIVTDEQFLHTVVSTDVLTADAELWRTFQQFLGNDPVQAWVLAEVTHKPVQKCDEDGNPTGEWELVSTAKWVRDASVPTPLVIREQVERPADVA